MIPHAEAFVDNSGYPWEILRVVTKLPEHSSAGPQADARWEMLKAIATKVAELNLQGYKISSSDSPNAHWS